MNRKKYRAENVVRGGRDRIRDQALRIDLDENAVHELARSNTLNICIFIKTSDIEMVFATKNMYIL